ncbi:tRNA pseudouridine(13) synthase TruD [Marinimicrobium sp. ABcell2]|uniref:tRNA pseudouridine(13) synthase TruD n=1 Tax=Marinimicrobium sp. ABcell2 TaxID=3069751 RepID=UPI0027B65758|nr:tRNA pseudouridine(13) synthase TruD [Marinimicrobium sp. ABcell2]MDQ2075407.1 tRNA pseudouridine(13) synthase TruD [Marinimicrobium sp. ABcell2]
MNSNFSLDFPYAYGAPLASAQFRVEPEDFQVEEFLGFEPSGEGEHCLVHLRKRGENTAWVADKIAQRAGVPVRDIGYCGLKDRHAVTSQWFSVYLPGQAEPDWSDLNSETVQVLASGRHNKKLRRGGHAANRFVIRLRDLSTQDGIQERLERLFSEGVPNYFGEQRFGSQGSNLHRAQSLLVDRRNIRNRTQRSMALSAARSWLFNKVLGERVLQDNWRLPLLGDPLDTASGPLWGRGRPLASEATLELESNVLAPWANWCSGLEHVGLHQERRGLLLMPEDASWRWLENDLELAFTLAPGTFATAILREIATLHRPA